MYLIYVCSLIFQKNVYILAHEIRNRILFCTRQKLNIVQNRLYTPFEIKRGDTHILIFYVKERFHVWFNISFVMNALQKLFKNTRIFSVP